MNFYQNSDVFFVIMPAKNLHHKPAKSEQLREMLQSSFEIPTLISSHIFNFEYFMNLVKLATDDSLIIYVHRNGTDRLRSAIRHVGSNRKSLNNL